ncbi:MAG: nucleotidyltransferase family protein [Flavobacteriales bacterium]|jgi:dTDP-glucose pyrophosphorylase|nr:nucleotidyltransferase family protein [Flavobacteriales bacterium]
MKNIINERTSIQDALKKINEMRGATLFVVNDEQKMLGTLSDGDIRRYLINDGNIKEKASLIMSKSFKYLKEGENTIEKFKSFRESNIRYVPFLDIDGRYIRTIDLTLQKSNLPLEAIIMAGGKGTRLRPMTLEKPKPLLEVGGKPIIEYNIDRLIQYGIRRIYISINYLKDQIKAYFGDGSSKGIEIIYIEEDQITGTLGSATYVEQYFTEDLLIMNSDILTNIDFEDLYLEHLKTEAQMTVATVPYKVAIPYGIIETIDQRVKSIVEKPTYTYYSNAGIYILNRKCLNEIPQRAFYNATDMIEKLIEEDRVVTNYPILSYWLDIGKPIDFEKAQQDVNHIEF